MKRPISTSLCFALASYAVLVTGTSLACAIWLPAFEVPAGTKSYRPMNQSLLCLSVCAATTLLTIGFAIATAASNPRRPLAWVLALILVAISIAPLPITTSFSKWVFETKGLELAS